MPHRKSGGMRQTALRLSAILQSHVGSRSRTGVSQVNLRTRGIICNPVIQDVSQDKQGPEEKKAPEHVARSCTVLNLLPRGDALTPAEVQQCKAVFASAGPVTLQNKDKLMDIIDTLGVPATTMRDAADMVEHALAAERREHPNARELSCTAFLHLVSQLKRGFGDGRASQETSALLYTYDTLRRNSEKGNVTVSSLVDKLKPFKAVLPSGEAPVTEVSDVAFVEMLTLDSSQAENVFVDFGGTPGVGDEAPTGEILISNVEHSKHPFSNMAGLREVVRLADVFCGDVLDFEEFKELVYLPVMAVARNPTSLATLRNQLVTVKMLKKFIDEGMKVVYNNMSKRETLAKRETLGESTSLAVSHLAHFAAEHSSAATSTDNEPDMGPDEAVLASLMNWWHWKDNKINKDQVFSQFSPSMDDGEVSKTGALKHALQVIGQQKSRRKSEVDTKDLQSTVTEEQSRHKDALKRVGLAMMMLQVQNRRESEKTYSNAVNSELSEAFSAPYSDPRASIQPGTKLHSDSFIGRVSRDYSVDTVLTAGITRIAKGTFRMQSKRDLYREVSAVQSEYTSERNKLKANTVTFDIGDRSISAHSDTYEQESALENSFGMVDSLRFSIATSTSSSTPREDRRLSNSVALGGVSLKDTTSSTPHKRPSRSFDHEDVKDQQDDRFATEPSVVFSASDPMIIRRETVDNVQETLYESTEAATEIMRQSTTMSFARPSEPSLRSSDRRSTKRSVVLPPEAFSSSSSSKPLRISRTAHAVRFKAQFALFRLAKPKAESPYYTAPESTSRRAQIGKQRREVYQKLQKSSRPPRLTPRPPPKAQGSEDSLLGDDFGHASRGGGGFGEMMRQRQRREVRRIDFGLSSTPSLSFNIPG